VHAELIDKLIASVAMTAAAAPGPRLSEADSPVQAGNGFGNTLPAAGLPGYDAAENDRLTREAPGLMSAMKMSGAPEMPQAGGGKAGREP
jgi:hypothetical protein